MIVIARSVFFIICIFFLGCSSSHIFCQPTISIIVNKGKKKNEEVTKNLKITKYYGLSLVYRKVTRFFFTRPFSSCDEQRTNRARKMHASSWINRVCICMCMCCEPVFFPPFSGQKRNPDVAHGKPYYLLDPLLAIISYFFVFLFFYLRILLKWTTHLDVRTVSNLL